MPHSNFKESAHPFNLGVGRYPCGQTFDFTSERDMNMKLQMHRMFCPKPEEGNKLLRAPKKVMALKEQQNNQAERM